MNISLSKAFFWFVFVGIIAFDLLNGFLIAQKIIPAGGIFSPSQLGRLFILVVMLYWVASDKISLSLFLVLLIPLICVELLSGLVHQQLAGVTYGLISSMKLAVLFVPLLVTLERTSAQQIAHYFVMGIALMSLVLFISLVLGIGLPTYGSGGFGTKSFFASGNDIGMYLGASALIIMIARHYSLIEVSWLSVGIIVLGLLSIASKTSLVFMLLCLAVIFSKTVFVRLLAILVVLAGALYWQSIWDAVSVVLDVVIRRFNAADGDWLFFITSGRNSFVAEAFELFSSEYSTQRVIFGRGVFVSFQSFQYVQQVDFLETDIFDIFFMFGLMGLLFYAMLWLGFSYKSLRYPLFLLPIVMLFMHSAIAGHVIFSGLCLQALLGLAAILSLADSTERNSISSSEATN